MEQTRNTLGLSNPSQLVYEDFPPSSDWTHDANCHVLLIDLPGFKREELKVRVDNQRKVTVSGERLVSENKYSRFKQMYELPEDSDIDNISGRFDNGLLFVIIPKLKKEGSIPANEIEEEKKEEKPEKEDVHDKQKNENKEEKHEEPKKDGVGQIQNDEKKDEKLKEEPTKNDDNIEIPGEKKEETKWNIGKGSLAGVDRKKIEDDMRNMAERVRNKEELEIMMKTAMEKIRRNKTMIMTAVLAFSLGLYISRKYQSGGD